jgi:hypothetical protein
MPDDHGAIVELADGLPPWICRKRLVEIIVHSEEEGWYTDYPRICFILKDETAKKRFLYDARRKLDDMGYDVDELIVLAASLHALLQAPDTAWSRPQRPKRDVALFE